MRNRRSSARAARRDDPAVLIEQNVAARMLEPVASTVRRSLEHDVAARSDERGQGLGMGGVPGGGT